MTSALRGGLASTSRDLESSPDLSSTWFIGVIVALIVLFYLICVYQCLISYCRKLFGREPIAPQATTGTVIVHDGRVFNLTEDQRRAVLETIYADNSKPATDLDVSPKGRRKRRQRGFGKESASDDEHVDVEKEEEDEDDFPVDVEIPEIAKNESLIAHPDELDVENIDSYPDVQFRLSTDMDDFESDYSDADDGHIDREFIRARSFNAEGSPSSKSDQSGKHLSQSPIKSAVKHETETDVTAQLLESATAIGAGYKVESPQEAPIPERCESMDSWDNPEQSSVLLTLPDLSNRRSRYAQPPDAADEPAGTIDEVAEENDDAAMTDGDSLNNYQTEATESALFANAPLLRRESFTTQTSEYTYDDDSCTTGDNICPICLGGYVMGNILIMSKHCSHVFHKECILEWLQKHDDCPVCRVSMVTETEMNRAATSLVGKTRMYRAVASMRTQNLHLSIPPSNQSPNARRSDTSPFTGTVRRSASNYAS